MVNHSWKSRPLLGPVNTYATDVHPFDVQLGDHVHLDGVYYRSGP